jgi:hypothetical protein
MNLENIDEVKSLRDHRERASKLADRMYTASLDNWGVFVEGEQYLIGSVVSTEYARQAVIEACADKIADIDERLRELGVTTPRHNPAERDAVSLRRDLEMYVRAWIRELGGKLRPKAHLIDALVLTTADLRKKAEGRRDDD